MSDQFSTIGREEILHDKIYIANRGVTVEFSSSGPVGAAVSRSAVSDLIPLRSSFPRRFDEIQTKTKA